MITFTVQGKWPFPLDMLRYDNCWPFEDRDVNFLGDIIEDQDPLGGVVEITFCTHRDNPTRERWASFMWPVVEVNRFGTIERS